MEIIETPIFTRQIQALLSEDEYRSLQWALVERPEQGALIKGSGGVRKVRWASEGRGKSGGIRAIYYWATADNQILMLLAYDKHEKDDLSQNQIRQLRQIVEAAFR